MKYFEDVTVGAERVFEAEYRVSEQEIVDMGQRWDPQPFHTDPVAARASMFGGLVASSAHIFCIFVSFSKGEIDSDKRIAAVSALGFDKLRWHAPVRPGDVLRMRSRVISTRESKSKSDLGIVTVANTIFNQNDEAAFTLESTFLCPKSSRGSLS